MDRIGRKYQKCQNSKIQMRHFEQFSNNFQSLIWIFAPKCSLFCSGGSCADVEMSKSSKILDQSETASFTNFTRNNPNENYTIIFAHFESEVGNPSPYDHNAQVQIQG